MNRNTFRLAMGSMAVALTCASAALPTYATPGHKLKQVKADYETVLQDLKDAIVNRGLVIDYVGHVQTMLARTGGAVGKESPYKHAKYMHFCSAKLTHAAVAADPVNVAMCPYTVFAYELIEQPGAVHIGFRRPMAGGSPASNAALAAVEKLLAEIVDEAAQ